MRDILIRRFIFKGFGAQFIQGTFGLLAIFAIALAVEAQEYASIFRNETIVFPIISPRVSDDFGPRLHPIIKKFGQHHGIDLAAPEGSTVRALMTGRVVFADSYAGYGKLVTIQHKGGYVSVYGHLSDLLVNPGQKVSAGTFIGRVGSTGRSTGPHLHLEWRKDGKPLDPLLFFPFLGEPAVG